MIKITEQMELFISLQRTNIKTNIVNRYLKSLLQDYKDIRDYLPKGYSQVTMLDIGCGLAGIDLLLYEHYNKNLTIRLFDYNSISENLYYGYKDKASHYNSLILAGQFLKLNGVYKTQIGLHEVEKGFPEKQYDLIISLISYCFHYPVQTYLKNIRKYKGVVKIFDVRKDTDQIKILLDNFEFVQILADYQKYLRILIK